MTINGVASWDGQKWDSLGHGAIGASREVLIRYKNKLYVENNGHIWAWDFATLTWDSVPGGQIAGSTFKACIFNNDLIIVGEFNKVGSVAVHNIVRFDGTTFSPVGFPTFSYYLRCAEVYNNELYVGGNFGNDTIYNAIAKWDGSQWVDVGRGFVGGGPPEVVTMKVYRNRLYAAGAFYGTHDTYMPSIAAWDGSKWSNIGGIYNTWSAWGTVYNMFILKNRLHVCGGFNMAGDIPAADMAIWNDTNWCSVNADFHGQIWVTTAFRDTMYVGEHVTIDNDSTRLIGRWVGSGSYVNQCGLAIGVEERENNRSLSVYPNPCQNTLSIKSESIHLENAEMNIKNMLGQSILSVPFSSEIDVGSMPPGCYFLFITTGDRKTFQTKFIKQ